MRIIFMGTPDFAVPALTEIIGAGHEIATVYTRAPKAAGRGMALRLSPVHAIAERFGIVVRTPVSLRDPQVQAEFAALEADCAIVVAYGLILPKAVLDAPRDGCLNLHGSLLPRWRGAAPIHRAIMAGDAATGVMVMRMDEGLDTGPIGMAERVTIAPDATTGDLHDVLARVGADLVVRALAALDRGSLNFTPQSAEGVTYAAKIDKAEARIDWAQPAQVVHDHVRGLSPFPGAFFEADLGRGPERVKILRAHIANADGSHAPGTLHNGGAIACADGALLPLIVQRGGKGPMPYEEFLRGARLASGTRFI